ncbi:hypothetical protein FACS1894217_13340 [Clostridia bacterium]|nr:hypothetical protein FACS1894217_13340 [Clostridia bacterium]
MKAIMAKVFKFLRLRERTMIIVAYPLVLAAALIYLKLPKTLFAEHPVMYGAICFVLAFFLVASTVYEIIARVMKHGRQGKHLKIRQRSGIELPEDK